MFNNSDEDEGIGNHSFGGYHSVHIGEIYANRYVVIQKLGWGQFSTVWIAKDFKLNIYVAMKVLRSGIKVHRNVSSYEFTLGLR